MSTDDILRGASTRRRGRIASKDLPAQRNRRLLAATAVILLKQPVADVAQVFDVSDKTITSWKREVLADSSSYSDDAAALLRQLAAQSPAV